jgi:hypothetical protein
MTQDFYQTGRAQGLKWATEHSHTPFDFIGQCDLMLRMKCDPEYRIGFIDAALEVLMPVPEPCGIRQR